MQFYRERERERERGVIERRRERERARGMEVLNFIHQRKKKEKEHLVGPAAARGDGLVGT